MSDLTVNECEACGALDAWLCDGCGCCGKCCNCTETDCDCDACLERRLDDETEPQRLDDAGAFLEGVAKAHQFRLRPYQVEAFNAIVNCEDLAERLQKMRHMFPRAARA